MNLGSDTLRVSAGVLLLGCWVSVSSAAAPQQTPPPKPATPPVPADNGAKPAPAPVDYIIGAGDILTIIVYGQDPALHSGDVIVRPDGKISRLLIDEVQAAGLTPLQLKVELTKAYSKYFQEPMVLVNPKEIRSRKVGIVGSVLKPGEYEINEAMDILQLITKAGGFQEFADRENIRLIRRLPNGKIETIVFNYDKVFEGKGLTTIPQLKPGDQIIVR
jgi:polysaccharide export outer membrane protein